MVTRVKDRKITKITARSLIESLKKVSEVPQWFNIQERNKLIKQIKNTPLWEIVHPLDPNPNDTETFRLRKIKLLEFLTKSKALEEADIQEILDIYKEAPKAEIFLRDPKSHFLILGYFHSVIGIMLAIKNERQNIKEAEITLRKKDPLNTDKRLSSPLFVFKVGRLFDNNGIPRLERPRTDHDVLKKPKVRDVNGFFDEALFIRDRRLVLELYEKTLKDEVKRIKNGEAFEIYSHRSR